MDREPGQRTGDRDSGQGTGTEDRKQGHGTGNRDRGQGRGTGPGTVPQAEPPRCGHEGALPRHGGPGPAPAFPPSGGDRSPSGPRAGNCPPALIYPSQQLSPGSFCGGLKSCTGILIWFRSLTRAVVSGGVCGGRGCGPELGTHLPVFLAPSEPRYFHLPTLTPGTSSLVLHPSSDVLRNVHKSPVFCPVPLCLPGGGCCPEGGHLVLTTSSAPAPEPRGPAVALGSSQKPIPMAPGCSVLALVC